MELPWLQRHEQPGICQFAAVSLEHAVPEKVGELATSATQVRPVKRDPSLRWLRGEVDCNHMPVPIAIAFPSPSDQVETGMVIGPAADSEQPPRARPHLAGGDGGHEPPVPVGQVKIWRFV